MQKGKAFTLIELAIVLLVIGILAGLMLRNVGIYTIQSRDTKRKGDLRNLSVTLVQYNAAYGQYPAPSTLVSDLQRLGVANLPTPPSTNEYYDYWACTSTGVTTYNHFILRTRLEQSNTVNPSLYADSYASATVPTDWGCNVSISFRGNATIPGPTTFSCLPANNYYCIAQ